MRCRRLLVLVAACAALFGAQAARATAGDFFVGVDEDSVKWGDAQLAAPILRSLGLKAVRITLPWHAGETQLSADDQQAVQRAVAATWGLRLVVSVYGSAADTPRTDEARDQFCSFAGDLVTRNVTVTDVVIWNDPNNFASCVPQSNADGSSSAPADYEALLAACWTKLHGLRPTVNVIADDASQNGGAPGTAHDTVAWYRKLGDAYRASGRHEPLFDTVAHVPHPLTSAERPWVKHPRATSVAEGDYAKLVGALTAAFGGTAQPLPGLSSVSIWYLGGGFQTTIDPDKGRLYSGRETDANPVPAWSDTAAKDTRKGAAPDQATQLADAIRVAYCQPTVGAFFNFHLADESNLVGWQSGVLWSDWTPKPSYGT